MQKQPESMDSLRIYLPYEKSAPSRYAASKDSITVACGILQEDTTIHVNSKGFTFNGVLFSWMFAMLPTFSGLTKSSYGFEGSVSAFKFAGARACVRNVLQRFVDEHEPEGQIYGSSSGVPAVVHEEYKRRDGTTYMVHGPSFDLNWSPVKHPDFHRETQAVLYNLVMGLRRLRSTGVVPPNDPAMLEEMLSLFNCKDSKVANHHYRHYNKIEAHDFNTGRGITFIFDVSGFKIYDGNCLYMREEKSMKNARRLWWEDWNQKVFYPHKSGVSQSPLVEKFLRTLTEERYVRYNDKLRRINYHELKTGSLEAFECDCLSSEIYNIKHDGEETLFAEDYQHYLAGIRR
jgi:hypothetical protein